MENKKEINFVEGYEVGFELGQTLIQKYENENVNIKSFLGGLWDGIEDGLKGIKKQPINVKIIKNE